MFKNIPFFPPQASSIAGEVDLLFFYQVGFTIFFSLLVAFLVIVFAFYFRRKTPQDRPEIMGEPLWLEIIWSVIPFGLTLVMFFWGASLYFKMAFPPKDAMEVFVVGKQWMWKIQHPQGKREINELHVPVGQNIKLTMASEDVIHSFYVPAFRMKMDVVPGKYTTAWFNATKEGEYHLFCAEYCGTKHAGMIGKVVVLSPVEYEKWLETATAGVASAGGSALSGVAREGFAKFQQVGCVSCHSIDGSQGRGPSLRGLFGTQVKLKGGRTVVADDNYLRESILNPQAKIVAGYEGVMPTYQTILSEEDVRAVIEYIKQMPEKSKTEGKLEEG